MFLTATTRSPLKSSATSRSCRPYSRLPPSPPIDSCPWRYCSGSRTTYRRSQSRNHGVCDTISATARMPTNSVPTMATTWSSLRSALMSKSLADAEVEPDPTGLFLASCPQRLDGIQLVAHVGPDRTDPRVVAQTHARVVAQIAHIEIPIAAPDVPGIEE